MDWRKELINGGWNKISVNRFIAMRLRKKAGRDLVFLVTRRYRTRKMGFTLRMTMTERIRPVR
jgi:hypothetical protein